MFMQVKVTKRAPHRGSPSIHKEHLGSALLYNCKQVKTNDCKQDFWTFILHFQLWNMILNVSEFRSDCWEEVKNTAIYEGYGVAVGKCKAVKHWGPLSRQPDVAPFKHCTKSRNLMFFMCFSWNFGLRGLSWKYDSPVRDKAAKHLFLHMIGNQTISCKKHEQKQVVCTCDWMPIQQGCTHFPTTGLEN